MIYGQTLCHQCNANWLYPNGQQIANAAMSQLYNQPLGGFGLEGYRDMRDANAKPKRPDLTPRQIDWCKANIPAFNMRAPK